MENFEVKILELVKSGQIQKGDLANLSVQHDDWCSRLQGLGPCNCSPEITVYKSETVEDWFGTWTALKNSYRKH
jgi:hypothetical protein